ncbi:dihydroorotase [Emcibacter nanhaiensis]|uniref:Dihydroorotase n=1 Tax=Emcibacter nanhaiensis TaxID=1505037 RepID=A0A501PG25_9PROT|nr:dihydroorotase [Emcibacter nanhaiensis]TPD58914.1 dihydroorotase [Emcibacter nanhaiensis]
MTTSFTLPQWYDLHTHFRQDETLPATVRDHVAMQCAGALAMPNTAPPVGKVFAADEVSNYKSIEQYRSEIMEAAGETFLEVIVPLYLTRDTTPKMIEQGASAGLLKACKYYPPHGTTGAEFGAPLTRFIENGVFQAMQDAGVTLCIHGEEHGLAPEQYFDRGENAEEIFYRQQMPRLIDRFPDLRIVGEHLTTKVGVDFIREAPAHVKANVTPQHLLYTIGSLLNGLKYHLYCLPLVKFEEDRAALRDAATATDNDKFFAGTDSAPHTRKTTPCGCAAGCYTGGIAPQLYAMAFEAAGVDLATPEGQAVFETFLCTIGRDYYGLPDPKETFTLEKLPEQVHPLEIGDQTVIPLPRGMEIDVSWRIKPR